MGHGCLGSIPGPGHHNDGVLMIYNCYCWCGYCWWWLCFWCMVLISSCPRVEPGGGLAHNRIEKGIVAVVTEVPLLARPELGPC